MSATLVHQTCSMCAEHKPEDQFYLRDNGRRRTQCIPCYAIYNRQQRVRHKAKRDAYDAERGTGWDRSDSREKHAQTNDQRFAAYLQRVYGITFDEFLGMSADQDDRCGICRKPDSVHPKLSVDHDHDTGHVRGLLCFACNTGIGKLGDDYATLQAAADYLNPETENDYND